MTTDRDGQALPDALPDGTLLGGGVFRVRAPLPDDLFGRRYAGERTSDGRAVVVRQLDPQRYAAKGMSLQEGVQVAQALVHRNLLPVLGLYGEGGRVLLVSEAPAGQTLRQIIEKRRAQGQGLSLKGAYNAIANVCNGLTFAHGALCHGALCPELVDITVQGDVRVMDLSLGRFLPLDHLERLSPGAWACVAPERRAGGPATPAADIYAIGAMLLEALTLRLPDEGVPSAETFRELPPRLFEVIRTSLLPDAAGRYKSPQELKAALSDAIQGGAQPTVSGALALRPGAGAPSGPKVSEQLPAVVSPPRPAPPQKALQSNSSPAESGPGTSMTTPSAPPPGFPPAPGGLPPRLSGPQAVASGQVDEDHERYLITKEDKMDYGPFPLREIRSQIEKGTVHADHLIHDLETGDKRRVREHPLIGEMSKEWAQKHAQAAMELRDHHERSKHRASVQKLLSGIFIVLLLVGGGVGAYFKFFYKPEVKTVVVKEPSSDDFWKGVEISMKVDPPQVKKGHRGKGKKVLRNGKWEDATNLGDASEEGGDETLTGEQVQGVMSKNFKILGGCLKEEAQRNPSVRKLDIEFLIKGTGHVTSVKVNGDAGSAVASCVFAKMQTVEFPKFNGAKTHAAFSIGLK